MKNKNNKKLNILNFPFYIFTILALGIIIIPFKVNAEIPGYVMPYNSTRFPNVENVNQNTNYFFPPSAYTNTTNSNTTNTNTTNTNKTKTVAKTENKSTTKNTNTETNKSMEKLSDLTANIFYGEDGFLPSGLMQWIFFAILILIIMILIRKIFGGEERYIATPLKHP